MPKFKVAFDKDDRKYSAGDVVHCIISVQVPDNFKARSFFIRFIGSAHTEWTRTRVVTQEKESHTVAERYTADQQFFDHNQTLFGRRNGPSKAIEPGSHDYEASFQLPVDLPTSFKHEYGNIRYRIILTFDVSWDYDIEHLEMFYVNSIVDLNLQPSLKESKRCGSQKKFKNFCCISHPLTFGIVLPRTGWTPGESIPITIEVDNDSDVKIVGVRIVFKKIITFTSSTPYSDKKIVSHVLKEKYLKTTTAPHQHRLLYTNIFLNPTDQWKIFPGCNIITCDYYIDATAIPSGCYSDLDTSIRLTIATVPFKETKIILLTDPETQEAKQSSSDFDAKEKEEATATHSSSTDFQRTVADEKSDKE